MPRGGARTNKERAPTSHRALWRHAISFIATVSFQFRVDREPCRGMPRAERGHMPRRVLITGGAGFLGSHLADELLARGDEVRALDVLLPQVHGADRRRPTYLAADVELIQDDIRDPGAIRRALDRVDVVYHFAARVGVGQSMYELAEYTGVN